MKQIKQWDMYWVELDPTQGSEIHKTRPCIVVSPNEMNEVLRTIIVVPLTGTIIDWPFRVVVTSTPKKSSAACDQLRVITKERLRRKAGSISPAEQRSLSHILQAMFQV